MRALFRVLYSFIERFDLDRECYLDDFINIILPVFLAISLTFDYLFLIYVIVAIYIP